MRTLTSLILFCLLAACGGGGGGGGETPSGGTDTFGISGSVASALTDSAVPGVMITLSGAASSTTYTDGTGHFSFTGLANGTYTVTASLVDAVFTPDSLQVTISGASASSQNFLALRGELVGSNIQFLPQFFLSSDQLRVSLHSVDGNMVFTDSSSTPLKKQPLDGSPPIALANRFGNAENVVLFDGSLFWIEGGNLSRMTPGGETTVLAIGEREAGADVTGDIVVDANYVYWVDQAPDQPCSPACNWLIERIPLTGGNPVTLATADRPIASLKGDAGNIYWEEESLEPLDPGCECGSKIKVVSKAGGAATVLVDGWLNGTLPIPPGGYTPGSWFPTGGIDVTASEVIFAVAGNSAYQLKSIPIAGGVISDLASVPSSAGLARNAVLNVTVSGADIFWIDTANSTLSTTPVTGGAVVTLVAGLAEPGGLATNSTTAFWTESGAYSGCCKVMGEGTVRNIPLTGGVASTVATGLDNPVALAVDATSVVWSEQWRIAKAPTGGGSIATQVSGISSDMARIAIAQSEVYILDGDLVKVVPLAGGKVEKFASAKLGSIADLSLMNVDIAADNANIYWTIRGVQGAPIVQKLAIAGGVPVILANEAIIPAPQDCYRRIALDQAYVYWSEGSSVHPVGCAVKKVPLNGGAVTTLVDQAFLADFTIDGVDLYFSEFSGSTIQRVSVDGGATSTVAENVFAMVLTSDADSLYWLDLQWGSVGTISRSAGSTIASILPIDIYLDPFLALDDVLVTSEGLYVSESQTGSIYRLY